MASELRLPATTWPLSASNWAFSGCGQLLPRQSLAHRLGSKSEKEIVLSEMIVFREPILFQRLAFSQGTQELFQLHQEILDLTLVQPIRRTRPDLLTRVQLPGGFVFLSTERSPKIGDYVSDRS